MEILYSNISNIPYKILEFSRKLNKSFTIMFLDKTIEVDEVKIIDNGFSLYNKKLNKTLNIVTVPIVNRILKTSLSIDELKILCSYALGNIITKTNDSCIDIFYYNLFEILTKDKSLGEKTVIKSNIDYILRSSMSIEINILGNVIKIKSSDLILEKPTLKYFNYVNEGEYRNLIHVVQIKKQSGVDIKSILDTISGNPIVSKNILILYMYYSRNCLYLFFKASNTIDINKLLNYPKDRISKIKINDATKLILS